MLRCGVLCIVVCVAVVGGVSTKLDFGEDEPAFSNNTGTDDDDVEVKHTIVVSTKLKNNNNNMRAITNNNNGNNGILTYRLASDKNNKKNVEDVPIVPGYRALDSTLIRTPDSRHKSLYHGSTINRNIRDELDIFPNIAMNPQQWKPANFFKNINWNYQNQPETFGVRTYRPAYQSPGFHRKISDAGVKEFYCKKCAELSNVNVNAIPNGKGCVQTWNNPWTETTTARMKLDGKLAKLN